MAAEEEWRDIPGLHGYKASSLGRIGRMFQKAPRFVKWYAAPRPMSIWFTRYETVFIQPWGAKKRQHLVHRLVASAFHGPPGPGQAHAAHLDGNPRNNRPENIAWATVRENAAHKRAHGTLLIGSRHWKARLTEDEVRTIKRRIADSDRTQATLRAIGADYGATLGMMKHIAYGKSWKHVV